MSMQKHGPTNYRVEAGQPIAEAFTATGWNRAQDAADVILGSQPRVLGQNPIPYQYGIVVPVYLTSTGTEYEEGSAVTLSGFTHEARRITRLDGRVTDPRSLEDYETHTTVFPEPFGVCVQPIREDDDVAICCISGMVIARIRIISSNHRFVSVATDRTVAGGSPGEAGVLETSDMGFARLVKSFGGVNTQENFGIILL